MVRMEYGMGKESSIVSYGMLLLTNALISTVLLLNRRWSMWHALCCILFWFGYIAGSDVLKRNIFEVYG